MKKLLLCLIILLLTGCVDASLLESIEVDDNSCSVQEEIDTHGGFLGDGDYFVKLDCPNLTRNSLSSNWKELPLPDTLDKVMNMVMCTYKDCNDAYTEYKIPRIEDGYYYFKDRHSDSINIYDDKEINNRSSYNFNLAICDINNKIIYYYELDT